MSCLKTIFWSTGTRVRIQIMMASQISIRWLDFTPERLNMGLDSGSCTTFKLTGLAMKKEECGSSSA